MKGEKMNTSLPSNQKRAICPGCGSDNTFAHYEHRGCPNSPTGITTWEREAWLGPDGRPISIPCPDCQSGTLFPPSYLYCNDWNHRW